MTTKAEAVLLLDEYMRRDDAVDVDDKQQQRVIRKLSWLEKADVNTVVQIVEEENSMYRGNSPQQTQQSKKQSIDEVRQIIEYFVEKYWSTYTRAIPPTENGMKKSNINYVAFGTAVRNRFNEGKRIGHDILAEIVLTLDQQKLLEHPPQVAVKEVEKEVHVPLTRREEAKHNFNLDKLMNSSGSPIKGTSEQVANKPFVPQAQLEAQARHDLRENEVMGDVRALIAGHSHSGSHAATRYEREILTNLMNTGIRQNLSAEKILANVKAKQDAMSKWGPQQALKELRPELFTGQPKAAY